MSLTCRHYVAYTGVKLPFKFVNEIIDNDLHLRNTYYKAYFDDQDKLISCQKVVYNEIEFEHFYEYYANGVLKKAEIKEADNDDVRFIKFDEKGLAVS